MREFKGTPGPWEYEPDNGWECAVHTSSELHNIEVTNHDMAEDACIEMYHNAKLIAAAPELLKSLQDFVSYAKSVNWDKSITGRHLILQEGIKAINKALDND